MLQRNQQENSGALLMNVPLMFKCSRYLYRIVEISTKLVFLSDVIPIKKNLRRKSFSFPPVKCKKFNTRSHIFFSVGIFSSYVYP